MILEKITDIHTVRKNISSEEYKLRYLHSTQFCTRVIIYRQLYPFIFLIKFYPIFIYQLFKIFDKPFIYLKIRIQYFGGHFVATFRGS